MVLMNRYYARIFIPEGIGGRKINMEIIRIYSDDSSEWEAVAEFLIGFILALMAKKEENPSGTLK